MPTQKQRMLAGALYRADDPELVADYLQGQAFQDAYNATPATDPIARTAILKQWLGSVGEGVVIRPSFRCDYGIHISIGARTFMNFDCVFLDCNIITIGADVQIAPGVHIYTATHPLDPTTRLECLESAAPVHIHDGVWLGGKTVVCPGVTIGTNTVVGAGSVVTRSLPPNVLALGNPCRVVRSL